MQQDSKMIKEEGEDTEIGEFYMEGIKKARGDKEKGTFPSIKSYFSRNPFSRIDLPIPWGSTRAPS